MMVVTFSHAGYVKRVPLDAYRAQGRGGRGVRGSAAREGDVLKSLFVANTHDYLLCFSNRGKVYWLKVYQLPEGTRTSQGRAIRNLLPLGDEEHIHTLLRVPDFDSESSVFFATRKGTVKKTLLEAYSRPRQGGIWAIQLDEDDELVGVGLSLPGDTILLGTANGKAIRFDEKAARAMGRQAHGVRGIKLIGDDHLVGMMVARDPEGTVFTACEKGYGKRTPLEEYPIKNRGGQGVINIKTNTRNGSVVGMALATDEDDVMFITRSGMIVRSSVGEMRPMGRGTQGVRLVNLKQDDLLVSTEIVSAADLAMVDEGDPDSGTIEPAAPPGAIAPAGESNVPRPDLDEADGPDTDAGDDDEPEV
jgi:DNA gyrase subunit A